MEELKIVAMVRFNSDKAYVFNRSPEFVYRREGNYLYAIDGPFMSVYKYSAPSKNWQAFGGRKFTLKLLDGGVEECNGQWWDDGYEFLKEKVGITITHVTISTVERLKKCYVFNSGTMDYNILNKMIEEYTVGNTGYYYNYYDYEKVITYDKLRSSFYERERKLREEIKYHKNAKRCIIKNIKNGSIHKWHM